MVIKNKSNQFTEQLLADLEDLINEDLVEVISEDFTFCCPHRVKIEDGKLIIEIGY